MAAVQQRENYNFDMFDVRVAARGSAAPARKPKEESPLKVVPAKRTDTQKQKEARSATANSLLILIFAAVIMAMLCLQINAGARSYEISRQIASVEADIEAARSENVRLNAQLNSFTSIGNVDDYATRVLGMSKIEGYQVEYIDLSQDGGVLYHTGSGLIDLFTRP
jgi:cell division protein FtsL